MLHTFDLQGHRGARGLKPENTLPSFEAALDVGATSIETDVHLTRDGVPVLSHDAFLGQHVCRLIPLTLPSPHGGEGGSPPGEHLLISRLSLAEVRLYCADGNPDPKRFPVQNSAVTPLAGAFARERGNDPYGIPALADFFAFAAAYASEPGRAAGKTTEQRAKAARLVFDLELKRVPFFPEAIGDDFTGDGPGLLERRVVEEVERAGLGQRVTVRSFDHRSVRAFGQLRPGLSTGVLVAGIAPLSPGQLAQQLGAGVYCPDYHFLDERTVRQLHADGIRVLPWTVNEPAHWQRLLDWGVDGITTDYPDRLVKWLQERAIAF